MSVTVIYVRNTADTVPQKEEEHTFACADDAMAAGLPRRFKSGMFVTEQGLFYADHEIGGWQRVVREQREVASRMAA